MLPSLWLCSSLGISSPGHFSIWLLKFIVIASCGCPLAAPVCFSATLTFELCYNFFYHLMALVSALFLQSFKFCVAFHLDLWHICCQNIRCLCDLVRWPFDLRTGPQVTHDMGHIQYDNFGLSGPRLSWARCRHRTDRQVNGQTDRQSTVCYAAS